MDYIRYRRHVKHKPAGTSKHWTNTALELAAAAAMGAVLWEILLYGLLQ